jgi:hypothetical protein
MGTRVHNAELNRADQMGVAPAFGAGLEPGDHGFDLDALLPLEPVTDSLATRVGFIESLPD